MTRQPWTGSTIDPTEIRLNISTNAAYYLMHHPEQWELIITDGVGEWLPNFSQLLGRFKNLLVYRYGGLQ